MNLCSYQSYFQKLTGTLPFLIKGPFSEFYGGPALLKQLDTQSSDEHSRQYYSWYLICLLSPVLHVVLMVYKKIKNRQDQDYAVTLRSLTVTGSRSPFKLVFLSISLLVFLLFLVFHFNHSKNLDQVRILKNRPHCFSSE